jgi:hypothetical protein
LHIVKSNADRLANGNTTGIFIGDLSTLYSSTPALPPFRRSIGDILSALIIRRE